MTTNTLNPEALEAAARAMHDKLWGDEGAGKETAYLMQKGHLIDFATASITAYLAAIPKPEPVAYQAAFCLGGNVFTTEKAAVEASPTNEARPIYPASAITKLQARVVELEAELAKRKEIDELEWGPRT